MVSLTKSFEPKIFEKAHWPGSWSPDGLGFFYGRGGPIGYLDITTGEHHQMVAKSGHMNYRPQISPDGRWLAFQADVLFITPVNYNEPVEEDDWIRLPGIEWGIPRWSPDGQFLYVAALLDGFVCIYAQRWNSDTGEPVGEPVSICHFHESWGSMTNVPRHRLGIAVAANRIAFTLAEETSNRWSGDLKEQY